MSFNSNYQQITLLLEMMEKNEVQLVENHRQHVEMIKMCLDRMKHDYEQRIQQVGSTNGEGNYDR